MKLNPVDISKTASASSIVFEELRRAIIKGDLAVGEALRQDEIAGLFNVSRIPVREALSRLEVQGLVRTQRYRGAVVSGLSAEEATELFDLRLLVEPEIIRRAVPLLSPEVLHKARECCVSFSESTEPMSWGDLNRAFHSEIYNASKLKFHLEVADNAMNRLDRYLRAQLVLSNGMEQANSEHFGILEACETGDAEEAAALTAAHIDGVKQSFLKHLNLLQA
ncbi:GntR family transcriptional regulator [Limibacillus sp. MBR-115]|jgi:DNA-binding GntR family transcriptional regulator|uniref:GntR family transcriptional regulator n=1 Tax=Limibacillus sp. MBR-115 TaxID=3156465 RepID=UPI003397C4CB